MTKSVERLGTRSPNGWEDKAAGRLKSIAQLWITVIERMPHGMHSKTLADVENHVLQN